MALKFFPETIILIKVDCLEGILNQNKIDGMVNDYTSSCELQRFYANIAKNRLQFLATSTYTTTDAMALKVFADTIQ